MLFEHLFEHGTRYDHALTSVNPPRNDERVAHPHTSVAVEPEGDDPRSWRRYRLVSDRALEVVYETDRDGVIQWISPSIEDLLGWTPDQLVGQPGHHLVHPLDAERLDALRTAFTGDPRPVTDLAFMVRAIDDSYRAVQMRAEPVLDATGAVTGSLVTLTAAQDRDAALRALATLSQANRILVQSSDETELLDRTCQALIDTGRYALAWYGRPVDDEEQSVAVMARAGEVAYLEQVTVSWGDNPHGRGPTGRCLRTGQAQVQNRFADDPEYRPWAGPASQHGFGGSVSLPVRIHGAIDGALMVYANEPGTFDALARELLEDLAADLGYGLERLRDVAALRDTTAREIEQRARLQGIFDSALDPLILLEGVRDDAGRLVDLRYTEVNAAACRYNRLTRQQMVGSRLLDLFPGQRDHGPLSEYFHTIETGEPTILDDYSYGHEVLAEERRYDIRAAKCGDGIALTWRDVTDRHLAAQDLADSERRYRLLAENSSDVIFLADDATAILWASEASEPTLGWSPRELIGHRASEYIHPDDLEPLRQAIDSSRHSGAIITPRYRWRRPDGTYRWMEAAGRPFDDEQGRHRRVVRLRDIDDQVRAERELLEREQLYRLLAENSTDVIILADHAFIALWVSPSVATMLGWQPADLVGSGPEAFIHPDDLAHVAGQHGIAQVGDDDLRQRYRVRSADGGYRWVEAAMRIVPAADDEARFVVRLRDIDEQVRAERELAAREEHYRLLAENASDIVWQISPDGLIQWTSPSIERILGWAPEDVIGRPKLDLIDPADRAQVERDRDEARSGSAAESEVRVLQPDGSSRWMAMSIRPLPSVADGMSRIVSIRDISEEVAARSQLEFVLGHDQLTGLANRATMLGRVEWLRTQVPRGRSQAVLCVGIDGLGEVNEALGHAAGDTVLTAVASHVVSAAGSPDAVGRGSGDELVVVLTDLVSGADAAEAAERIRLAVQEPVAVAHQRLTPTVSIGIATGGADVTGEQLLREASLAMRKAKNLGRDQCVFADPSLAAEAEQRITVETGIRNALQSTEFEPWFQPIIELAQGRVVGYEALARWMHKDGTLEPADFLAVAARSSLISELDLAMLDPVVRALARLPESVFVGLNVTGQTLARTPYAELVLQSLDRHGIDPGRLHLEVTETMLLALDEDVISRMRALADRGCRWYVDDFGTGYSSISHLRDLPVAGLKLDKSFTDGIESGDPTSRQLADGLVGLANGLGLDTVAEGIETEAQARYLRTLGWRHGQGWLYGRAVPLAELVP